MPDSITSTVLVDKEQENSSSRVPQIEYSTVDKRDSQPDQANPPAASSNDDNDSADGRVHLENRNIAVLDLLKQAVDSNR